jgi:hypothetical protein
MSVDFRRFTEPTDHVRTRAFPEIRRHPARVPHR